MLGKHDSVLLIAVEGFLSMHTVKKQKGNHFSRVCNTRSCCPKH